MLRNILRANRKLIRRKIDIIAPKVIPRAYTKFNVNLQSAVCQCRKRYSTQESGHEIDQLTYEHICLETLESLCDYFDELVDSAGHIKGADVTFGDGVLTVNLGSHGTYVINRQTPNKQIWLSSPLSGPKRYDLVLENGGYWIYRHDGVTLHRLLQEEISKIVPNADFRKCLHSLV